MAGYSRKILDWELCETTEHVRQTAYFSYEDAKEKMVQWINFYNNERLHGALLYMTPEDYFAGRKEKRLAGRTETQTRQDCSIQTVKHDRATGFTIISSKDA